MTLPKQLILTALAVLNLQTTFGMEREKETHLVIIPGQNGCGGDNINTVLPQFNETSIHPTGTPNFPYIDFGQSQCIKHLEQTMQPLLNNKDIDNIIIHASSQGTATALNYTATNQRKIKALILEAPLLSGNSAILHNTFPTTTSSLIYYGLPYLAKVIFPFYAPAGQQPILTCDSIPNDLPIIIMHATEDPQLSFTDAKALYAHLKNQGNNNVYFLPIDDYCHVNMLSSNDKELAVINAILKKYELPCASSVLSKTEEIPLTEYQPEPERSSLLHFITLKNRENNLYFIDLFVKGAFWGFIFYILHRTGTIDTISSKISSHI